MGNLLNFIKKDSRGGDAQFYIDFENAKPTAEEQEVYGRTAALLAQSAGILASLSSYLGAGDEIRVAISNPSNEEAQQAAWAAVSKRVLLLKDFFVFSQELDIVVPLLLEALCARDPMHALASKQATAKQFAQVLQFVLAFDEQKLKNPSIQNDFSYYRRTLSRLKMTEANDDSAVISNEDANRMSLFYAHPTPLLRALSDATAKFVSENKEIPLENTTDCLSAIANTCRGMIESPEFVQRCQDPQTITFCQRVMVGSIILYDHVHLLGAFSKKNPSIDVRACVRAVKMHNNPNQEDLLNALRYTTKHLNDEDTPKTIKSLLE